MRYPEASRAFSLWIERTPDTPADVSPLPEEAFVEPDEKTETQDPAATPTIAALPSGSRAFTLWTTASALARPTIASGSLYRTELAEQGSETERVAFAQPPSRAFSLWTTLNALANPRLLTVSAGVSSGDVDAPGEESVSTEGASPSRAFTLWTTRDALSAARMLAVSAAVPSAVESATEPEPEASPEFPVTITESKAFTLWTGKGSTQPSTFAPMTDPDTTETSAGGAIAIPGGSKAFSLWAPATAPSAPAEAAKTPSGKPLPVWERSADRAPEAPGILPLLVAAIALLALLIALFVIAARNKELKRLEGQIGVLKVEKQLLTQAKSDLATGLAAKGAQLALAKKTLAASEELGAMLESSRDQLQATLADTKEQHATEIGAMKGTIGGLEEELGNSTRALSEARQEIAAATVKHHELVAAKSGLEAKLQTLQVAYEKEKVDSAEKLAAAQSSAETTRAQLAAAESRLVSLSGELSALRAKIADLERPAEPASTPASPDEPKAEPEPKTEPAADKEDEAPAQV